MFQDHCRLAFPQTMDIKSVIANIDPTGEPMILPGAQGV
jgi:hypothetical protein